MKILHFHIVTLFPEIFDSFLRTSLVGKAVTAGLISVEMVNPRDFAVDKHRTVDDTPFGGGEGMLLKAPVVVEAIESIDDGDRRCHRVLLTPQGRLLDQRQVTRWVHGSKHLVLVCGRYEGLDERVLAFVDEEVSVGDFVLNGGEVAAMAVVDAASRLVPGVLGNAASAHNETHQGGLLEYPQFTRPRAYRGKGVPEVLLSGDHQRIQRWRRQQRLVRTRDRRPDLWRAFRCSADDAELLSEVITSEENDGKQTRPNSGSTATSGTYIALVHHPVYDRDGRIVTTALTNLDLHDIARASCTYGLASYFVVTPLQSQQELAQRILGHWQKGHGARYHARRAEALSRVRVVATIQNAVESIAETEGRTPMVVATTAARRQGQIGFEGLTRMLGGDQPLLLLLGTGWGLSQEILDQSDKVLCPIEGPTHYNHLSVRCAAAIILDRLLGVREEH